MDLRLKRAKVKNKITFVSGNVGDEKVSTLCRSQNLQLAGTL